MQVYTARVGLVKEYETTIAGQDMVRQRVPCRTVTLVTAIGLVATGLSRPLVSLCDTVLTAVPLPTRVPEVVLRPGSAAQVDTRVLAVPAGVIGSPVIRRKATVRLPVGSTRVV